MKKRNLFLVTIIVFLLTSAITVSYAQPKSSGKVFSKNYIKKFDGNKYVLLDELQFTNLVRNFFDLNAETAISNILLTELPTTNVREKYWITCQAKNNNHIFDIAISLEPQGKKVYHIDEIGCSCKTKCKQPCRLEIKDGNCKCNPAPDCKDCIENIKTEGSILLD